MAEAAGERGANGAASADDPAALASRRRDDHAGAEDSLLGLQTVTAEGADSALVRRLHEAEPARQFARMATTTSVGLPARSTR